MIGNLNNLGRLTVSLRLSFCASVSRQKLDADLVTVNTYQLAAAIRSPVEDKSKKNSLRSSPSSEPSMTKRAPVCETSIIKQLRRHVPSIPIM